MLRGKLTHEQVQQEELGLLIMLCGICNRFGLRYSLAGGTLLGAIRHNGFIPWDDDIDVNMPRPDFNRLIELKETIEREYECRVQFYPENSKTVLFIKILSTTVAVREAYAAEDSMLWVDVFPVDGMPNRLALTKLHCFRARTCKRIALMGLVNDTASKTAWRRRVKHLIRPLSNAIGLNRVCEKRLVQIAKSIPFGSTDYVGGVLWGYGSGERLPSDAFDKLVTVEFEGESFFATEYWDMYLSGLYGDYMALPPEDKRQSHGIDAWRLESDDK